MTEVPPPRRSTLQTAGLVSICLATCLLLPTSSVAQPLPGYYDAAEGLDGEDLREALHGIIKDHTKVPYTHSSNLDTWDALEWADEDPDDSDNILDIYRNRSHEKTDRPSGWNREHTWPTSYGFTNDNSCNYPYTDLHHLRASNASYNSSRGNRVFDLCPVGCTEYAVDTISESNWGTGTGSTGTWEVWESRKGDIARGLLYMDVRYAGGKHGITNCDEPELILTDDRELIVSNTSSNESTAYMGVLTVLLAWHLADPVDYRERHRNDIVYFLQGNRNPFVDRPEFVCELWGISGCTGGDTTAPDAPEDLDAFATTGSVFLEWTDNTEGDLIGYHVYRSTSEGGPYARITNFIHPFNDYLDESVTNGTTYYYVVTAFDDSHNESAESNEVSATPPVPSSGGPLDAGGYVVEQLKDSATLSITIPAETIVEPGGTIVIGRDATKGQFEAFWGPLPSNAVYINGKGVVGGSGFPVINGGQEYRLFDALTSQIDPASGYQPASGAIVANRTYQRDSTLTNAFTSSTSPNSTATPGVYNGTVGFTGQLVISEISDATGTGNFVYEFVELYYDPPPPPLDASGFVVEQFKDSTTLSITLPAETEVEPGGTIVIGRDATKVQFEAFWGPLPSNAVYINGKDIVGGNGFPVINGGQEYRLFDDGSSLVDPVSGYLPGGGAIVANRTYQRDSTASNAFTSSTSPNSTATPGVYNGTKAGVGKLVITEIADATGTGNFVYEFVELYYDAD